MPSPDATPTIPSRNKARGALVWLGIAVVTVAVVAGATLLLRRLDLMSPRPTAGARDPVVPDDQYVVFLSQIEVDHHQKDGGKWDATDGGPDIRYDIYWRGNRVFRSSTREDTLVARWNQDEVGITDLIAGVSEERTLKAARITAHPGEKIEFRVVDDDPVRNDDIGTWEVAVESLKTGDQVWSGPAPGILQAVCRVLRVGR
jgi:hypothetical protein